MAQNVFAQSPVDQANEKARSVLGVGRATAPAAPAAPSTFDSAALARTYQVPENVIQAVTQVSGIEDPAELAQFGDGFARTISGHLQSGMKMKDAMTATFGEGMDLQPILDLAVSMAGGQPAPERGAPKPQEEQSRIGRAFDQGMAAATVRGTDMVTDMSAALEEGALGRALYRARRAIGIETDTPEARAQALRDAPKEPGYQAAKDTLARLEADGFQVSDWRDIRGLGSMVQFAAENIATSLPQMGATLVSGPLSAPLTIALLGGEANDELKERTDLSEADRVAIATGAGTAMWAFETIGLGAVFGRLVPSQVVKRAIRGELAEELVKGGITKGAARVLEAGIAEGVTETIQEGIVMGATSMAGGEYTRDEVTKRLTDAFIAGGAAGGGIRAGMEPIQAVSDRLTGKGQPEDQSDTGDAQGAGPTATLDQVLGTAKARFNELNAKANGGQMMAPETGEVIQTPGQYLTAEENAERDFLGQNMSNPEVLAKAAGVTIIEPPQSRAAVDPQSPVVDPTAATPAPPEGPLARAARAAGPRLRPDLTPEAKVRIEVANGNPIDAVFKGESNGNLNLEINGEQAVISADMLANGQATVTPVDVLAEANEQANSTGLEDIGTGISGAIGGNLRDMLFQKIEQGDTTENGSQSPVLQMAKLIKDTGGNVTRDDIDAINTLSDEIMALPVEERRAAAIERAKAWVDENPMPNVVTPKPASAGTFKNTPPRLLKRPLTARIKSLTGGIDPQGPLGEELKARGINPQTAPGLFRNGGVKDLDNLPAVEMDGYGPTIETDGQGYVSQQWIIDSLEAEARGEPVQDAEQEQLQQERDAQLEEEEFIARGGDAAEPVATEAPASNLDRFAYIDEASRADMIESEISQFESDARIKLTPAEKAFVSLHFEANGNSVEDAFFALVQMTVDRGDFDGPAETAENNVPWGDEGDDLTGSGAGLEDGAQEGASGDQRPTSTSGDQGKGQEGSQDPERTGPQGSQEVATEQTPEGEQTLIPGVAPITDKDRAESAAKKPKRGGNAPTDFGLFDTGARDQGDMFADGPESASTDAEQTGPFGPIIKGYEGDWKGAALELERRQTGEVPGALTHPDVGDIALVWGKAGNSNSDGMGLAKLIAWHPEVLDDLQGRLNAAEVVSRTDGRIQLRSETDNIGIRLQFDGQNNTWLLTAFERGRQRTERSSSRLSDIWDGSFSPSPLTQTQNTTTVGQNQSSATAQTESTPQFQDQWSNTLIKARHAAKQLGMNSETVGTDVWRDRDQLVAAVDAALRKRELTDLLSTAGETEAEAPRRKFGDPDYTLIDAMNDLMDMQSEQEANGMIGDSRLESRIERQRKLVKRMEKEADDLAGTVTEAAAEADPNPTDAQKEAGNYKKGHVVWNGMNLTIENAKGSERSGTDQDGETWSVTMPAHYGYFKMTEGADGEHVDFYMGEAPDADYVMWIDQADANTGKFDEHKIMVGFPSRGAALEAYRGGFSDGRADERIGGIFEGNVAQLKAWLESTSDTNFDSTKPVNGKLDFPFKKAKAAPEPADVDGQFGPVIDDFKGDWKGAALELERRKTGEATAALSHPDVGDIALVWGKEGTRRSDGYGLSKLIAWHPDVLDDLQGRIDRMEVTSRTQNRIQLESASDRAGIRLDWDGTKGAWLIGAYDKGTPRLTEKFTGTLSELWGGMAPSPQRDSLNVSSGEQENQGSATSATGILSSLSQEKQDRAAALKKRLADKARNQTSSGLDPEYITLGGELVALYIEAGTKRFGQMLRDFAETTGLSMREAQAPMRAAYNHVRDEMELDGQDVSDMDSAVEVMAEVRAAIADAAAPPAEPATTPQAAPTPAPTADPLTEKMRAAADGDLVQHTTKRGKVLSGYILKGVTKDQAKSIDNFTWLKDGGFFIREADAAQYLAETEDMVAEQPAQEAEQPLTPAEADQNQEPQQQEEAPQEAEAAPDTRSDAMRLVDHFAERLQSGAAYASIVSARKEAEGVLGRSLNESDLKMIEESIESGIVKAARAIVRQDMDTDATYDALVDLYGRQPKLAQRTSTSIEMQAYSTPAPMAFMASTLAGVGRATTVYEPSAGTGMLLMDAEPANITANELQASRMELLSGIYAGADLRNGDAMQDTPPSNVDAVIANPPFGKVKGEDGTNKTWPFEGSTGTTTEIDHAISMRALSAMADNGRAVLIVGGHQGDADTRKQKYRSPKPRAFWKKLYDNYNVTEHFTLDGGLYSRQGAGWPVDVVVIEGRGTSKKALPMKEAPILYNTWDQLKGRIDGRFDSLDTRGGRSNDSDGAVQTPQGGLDFGPLFGRPDAPVSPVGGGSQSGGARPNGTGPNAAGGMGRPDSGSSGSNTGNAGTVRNPANEPSNTLVPDSSQPDQEQSGGQANGSNDQDIRPDSEYLPVTQGKPRKQVERNNTEAETSFQVQYSPRSNARFAVGTLVPSNVADAVREALQALEKRVGDIDEFVARELGYSIDEMLGTETKQGAFSAEQVDALALAIDNVDQGAGFIIGDQTGVGKGRIVAGMIRYAVRKGRVPVFFTAKPGLYGDMMRDLRDIGSGDLQGQVMLTNNDLRGSKAPPVSSKAGDVIASGTKAEQDVMLRHVISNRDMPEGKSVIFTTYDQMNTQKGEVTQRMRAMMAIADRAMFILDESHEAGGTAGSGRAPKEGDAEPRSVFVRRMLAASPNGKMFSSATFAKNSTVMSLYTSTNLSNALANQGKLQEAVERGGDALLQVISSALVQDGQYVRRERTYEGISMSMDILETDPIAAENGARAVREIFMLDNAFMEDVRAAYIEEMANEGEGAARDGAVGEAGASSTNFASTMHNVVGQLLLSIKAGAVADKAIELHRAGKKPIIALSNTNASIIDDYVRDQGIELGNDVNVPFNEILRRYIQRLRRITLTSDDGQKSHVFLTDNDIERLGGQVALDEVRRIEREIETMDLGDLPGSPIDFLRDRMVAGGVKVGEITGRTKVIENGTLIPRKHGPAENKRIMNRYNSGELDAIILNRSGATGFSMHATGASDNDGKVRAMLILQPDNNIDIFMQMLGRINRTGQIELPEYYIAVSDLAVEKRPAAILMKKLASLNASTTANKKSAVTMEDAPDFMNKYGDQVVRQFLLDNPEISAMTGVRAPARAEAAGVAAKLTGKLIILGPKRTQQVYEDIEASYANYIEELNSIGANDLEVKVMEIDARQTSSEVIEEGTAPDSAFGRDTVLETVNAKVIGKPYTVEKLDELVAAGFDGIDPDNYASEVTKRLNAMFQEYIKSDDDRRKVLMDRLAAANTDKKRDAAADMVRRHDSAVETRNDRFREVKQAVTQQYAPGKSLMISFMKGGETIDTVYAMSLGADLSKLKDNPTAASRINVRFALASPGKQITKSLSALLSSDNNDTSIRAAREQTVRDAFENGQKETREDRQIVTGNVIAGYSKFGGRGQIVFFRREDGSLDQGIILPKDFDAQQALADAPKNFGNVEQAIEFVETAGTPSRPGILTSSDGVLKVQRQSSGVYLLEIERSRGHRPYIFNRVVREMLGDFTSRSGPFKKYIENRQQLIDVLKEYEESVGAQYQATAFKDEAQAIIDADKPRPAGGTLRARVARGDAQTQAFADRLKQIEKGAVPQLHRDLRTELKAVGISHRITLDVVPDTINFPGLYPLDGYFLDSAIGEGIIGVSATASDGPLGILRHEIIHALRNTAMWGGTHGLFTAAEWKSLVAAARKQTALKAQIDKDYPDLNEAGRIEETIAEMFRMWSDQRDQMDATPAVRRLLARINDFITAIANALRKNGANEAAKVFESIRSGEVGGRDPDGPSGGSRSPTNTLQAKKKSGPRGFDGAPSVFSSNFKDGSKNLVSNALTQAMAGKAGVNILALVPGRPLLEELGRNLPSAKSYLKIKMSMDAMRNEWHAKTDTTAQQWRKILTSNRAQNSKMMDLMHDATIAGVDPSIPFLSPMEPRDRDIMRIYKKDTETYKAAAARVARHEKNKAAYDELVPRYKALPASFQRMFVRVRDRYTSMANAFEEAIEENANKAMTVSVRRAERAYERKVEQMRDDGLKGPALDAAIEDARRDLETAKAQKEWSKLARLQQLRQRFEANRLEGPYFPLSRFGDFFVTVRDEDGKVVSFSQFEKVSDQKEFAKQMRADDMNVETGVMKELNARETVDPNFVADVEALLDGIDADSMVMDAIWQQWLMTLPNQSMRRSRIHRKGTPGYDGDAFRAFGKQMFHGAHQLARLKHSLDLGEALDEMAMQARSAADPDRAGLVVKEINKRHEYVMNPKGSAWSQAATSAAFIYYLGITPAAAMVNLTQTTVMGTAILGAFYGKGGSRVAARELSKAMVDFTQGLGRGKGKTQGTLTGTRLTDQEKTAMQYAYDAGFADKSEAHDLGGVGETGVEYSPVRTKIMGYISFFFHHAERVNREVTFLAAYRMAKQKGLSHDQALEKAGSLTFKTHFDYQNTSRPRLMQDDYVRVALVFRNFQLNMLWRLFRDVHQSVSGQSSAVQKEARAQLLGISAQMLLHAGVKGVWGYSILMMLAGMFFAGGEDEAEQEMEKALLAVLPRDAVGMLLNGIPGHLTGIDLRARIGMPDLWFRSPDRELEGSDEYYYWVSQLLGAVPEIAHRVHRGAGQAAEGFADGDFWGVMRGVETASPKFIRDIIKSGRYTMKGAETFNGDPIIEEFRTGELIGQIIGFSPARLSERYDANRRLKNAEQRIMDERRSVMSALASQIMDGQEISARNMAKWDAYNAANPDYPIRPSDLRDSVRGRVQSSLRNEFGVQINPRLNDRLRENAAGPISR